MIDFLLGSIITGIGVYVGFTMGKGSSIIPEETQKQVKRLIQNLPIKKDVGAVSRPTEQQIENWNNPLIRAEKNEMKDFFDKEIPKQ